MPFGRRPAPSSFIASIRRNLVFLLLLAVGIVFVVYEKSGEFQPGQMAGGYRAVDGDSLRRNGEDTRLNGIDAPELHQSCQDAARRDYACGAQAKAALQSLIAGKVLDCAKRDTDRYGRRVATCRAGTLDINAEMVRLGWAIAYRKHSAVYVGQEDEARRAGRGLWQGHFENPEAWRLRQRRQIGEGSLGADAALAD